MHYETCTWDSDAGTRGARVTPPIFGRSVNPFPAGEGRLSPPITTGTPNVFHLLASLSRDIVNISENLGKAAALITPLNLKIRWC